ncbi:MAG: glycosyltransferase [Gammaproteobacteria bacterium]|nr:glycosyltransferase [Gammaproteobacteria bacterium]
MPEHPQVSITLTRYREPDWLILETLESLASQEGIAAEVLFLDQTPTEGIREHCEQLSRPGITFVHATIPANSLSYARNEAIRRATADMLLYIDSDAIAQPDWAATLRDALSADDVGVAGTKILPKWHGRPLLIARSRLVQDQYSLYDLGEEQRAIHRVVGASFGIHRARLGEQAYFDEKLGRREGILFGGEESDLCRRAAILGLKTLYDGGTHVYHQILPERLRYRWLLRRFFYAGVGRAQLGGAPNPSNPLGFWDYVALPVVLPFYAAGYRHGKRMNTRQT